MTPVSISYHRTKTVSTGEEAASSHLFKCQKRSSLQTLSFSLLAAFGPLVLLGLLCLLVLQLVHKGQELLAKQERH